MTRRAGSVADFAGATPSSRRRVDGVPANAMIQHERADVNLVVDQSLVRVELAESCSIVPDLASEGLELDPGLEGTQMSILS